MMVQECSLDGNGWLRAVLLLNCLDMGKFYYFITFLQDQRFLLNTFEIYLFEKFV